jgi:3-deoxy-D-manno-octulosonate 8-phosphate phosphatase KdsC-like HAD superfamily phosphatase
MKEILKQKAAGIKLLLTDNDGVLTDAGVYYNHEGELLKKSRMRDGMGVKRLRKFADVNAGIITGENSPSLIKRTESDKYLSGM